jgi:hypothetical protein
MQPHSLIYRLLFFATILLTPQQLVLAQDDGSDDEDDDDSEGNDFVDDTTVDFRDHASIGISTPASTAPAGATTSTTIMTPFTTL